MKSANERRSSWPLIAGIALGVLALTAGPALAALTFSGTSISGNGAVVIDGPSTISIGTSTATGIIIGRSGSTTTFPGSISVGSCAGCGGGSSQWTTSGSDIYFQGGNIGIDTSTPASPLTVAGNVEITASNPAAVPVSIQRASSQTADLMQFLDSDGSTVLSKLDKDGNFQQSEAALPPLLQNYTGANNLFTSSGAASSVALGLESTAGLGLYVVNEFSGDGEAVQVDSIVGANNTSPLGIDITQDLNGKKGVQLVGLQFDSPTDGVGHGTAASSIALNIDDQTIAADNWAIKTGKGKVEFGDVLQVDRSDFSDLPTCNSAEEGTLRPVTDSTTSTLGEVVVGGGSNHILAYCDGTNWTVMAK